MARVKRGAENASFVAIDFETAHHGRDSACAVGAVLVEGGKVTDTFAHLIRPPGNDYFWYNTKVHGLSAADTADAPDFADVWRQLRPFIKGQTLVAHNAEFDESVLHQSLGVYGLRPGRNEVLCSRDMARVALPGRKSYRLPDLCRSLRIHLDHHDALSDANAAAQLVLRIVASTSRNDLPGAARELGFRPPRR